MAEDSKEKTLLCSFCGKNQTEVKKLIAGPSVFICDECVDLCNDIIVEENDVETDVINDNNETVTCRICGEQCKRVYGKHLKFAHNNMTTEEYKRLYPGSPIAALSDKIKEIPIEIFHYKKKIKFAPNMLLKAWF